MKKLISTILILCMMFSLCCYASIGTAAFASENPEACTEEVELLKSLGIFDDSFQGNRLVSRKEFAVILCKALGLYEITYNSVDTGFSDVASNDSSAGSIKILKDLGIINGRGDGMFGADNTVTYAEALKMLLNALGYETYAQSMGGYYIGYFTVAANKKLTKNIDIDIDSNIDVNTLAKLIYNSLEVDFMRLVQDGTSKQYSVLEGKTILTEKLKIKKYEGVITATHDTTLNGTSTLKDNQVQIGDKTFYIGQTNAQNYMGYSVSCYVRADDSDDIGTLLFVKVKSNNHILTIYAEDILTSTSIDEVVYWDKAALKNKTAAISPVADLIYNGKAYPKFTSAELQPSTGKVVLINVDNDDNYDTIIVMEYTTVVVDAVYRDKKMVLDKYTNVLKELDCDSLDYRCTITKDGAVIDVDALQEWDVLSIRESKDDKLIKVDVCTRTVDGKVERKEENGVYISGEYYEISTSYLNSVSAAQKDGRIFPKSIEVNEEGTFYFDVNGRIAAIQSIKTGSKYAYLYNINVGKGINRDVSVNFLTTDNGCATFDVNKKVNFNGVKTDSQAMASNPLMISGNSVIKQLVTYELDSDGKVKTINTAQFADADDAIKREAIKSGAFTKSKAEYLSGFSKVWNSFGLKTYLDDETLVFFVTGNSDGDDARYYRVGGKNDLKYHVTVTADENYRYSVTSYDESEFGIAKAVVVKEPIRGIALGSSLFLVDKVVQALDDDGNPVQRLYGISQDNEYDAYAHNNNILNGVKKGDIIQLCQDVNDRIMGYELVCTAQSVTGMKNTDTIGGVSFNYGSSYYIMVGRVTNVNYSQRRVVLENENYPGTSTYRRAPIVFTKKTMSVSLYDEETGRASAANIEDIQPDDYLVLRWKSSVIEETIIIRLN